MTERHTGQVAWSRRETCAEKKKVKRDADIGCMIAAKVSECYCVECGVMLDSLFEDREKFVISLYHRTDSHRKCKYDNMRFAAPVERVKLLKIGEGHEV